MMILTSLRSTLLYPTDFIISKDISYFLLAIFHELRLLNSSDWLLGLLKWQLQLDNPSLVWLRPLGISWHVPPLAYPIAVLFELTSGSALEGRRAFHLDG